MHGIWVIGSVEVGEINSREEEEPSEERTKRDCGMKSFGMS